MWKTSIMEPNEIFLLSKNFKKVEEESLTPTKVPFSPFFKSDNKTLEVCLINPAGFGIGSP